MVEARDRGETGEEGEELILRRGEGGGGFRQVRVV